MINWLDKDYFMYENGMPINPWLIDNSREMWAERIKLKEEISK